MRANKETIRKVIDFIEENLDGNLDLDTIANSVSYSKFHLNRMFFEIVGCTIHKYIQKRRLSEAARELIYSNKSILDISLDSGYETQQSFTLAFKKLYNMSPQVYRKMKNYMPIELKFNVGLTPYTKFNMNLEMKVA